MTRQARRAQLAALVADLDNSSPECLVAVDELRIMDLEDENAKLRAFIARVSQQRSSRPDYWSTCSQCEHNTEDAKELLDTPQPK